MYSVVLATMLTASSAIPDFHRCHNSCYAGYSCYSGYSSYGGGCSCYSGYSGYSGYACHGCHGIFPIFHRHHCSTGVAYSCHCTCTRVVYSTCSTVCCGGVIISQPKVIAVPKSGEKVNPPKTKPNEQEEVAIPSNTARVIVNLPSDARLWVENVECPLTSDVRSFNTPALNLNHRYFYNVRAEIVRDGRTISETQRVIIIPGAEARVDFNTSNVIGTASR
ncbi:MAG: TIGR03000 domain-containing protein [Gemmataceae bacterium]|nr:TIGR03000 domain-containing protein [Gemmataceae bacterium]